MSLSAMVQALMDAGATKDMVVAAVRAFETSAEEKASLAREGARQRKIKQREKEKSLQNNDGVTVTSVTCVTNPSPLSPLDGFPTPLPVNPPITPHPNLSQTCAQRNPAKPAKPSAYPDHFERFWKLYPPNGSSKGETWKSYEKAQKSAEFDIDLVEQGAKKYAEHIGKTGSHVANATTWLNNGRWTVEYSNIPIQRDSNPKTRPTATHARFEQQDYRAGTEGFEVT